MAFLSRLKQDNHKIRLLSNQIKRCYFSNHSLLSNSPNTSSRSLIPPPCYRRLDAGNLFLCNVRFYAAPVQFLQQEKEKKEEKPTGPKLNEKITAEFVRLVDGKDHNVVPTHEALTRARELRMDLVEVGVNTNPPVCKIYDYKKELFLQKERAKESKKKMKSKGLKSTDCKEFRFAGKITKHDLQMKADAVKRLIEKGYRVKCTAIEPTDAMDLKTLLSRFTALIEDVAVLENEPQVEKKQAFVVVRHVKFGGSKKGGKKASKASTSVSESKQLKGDQDAVGTGSEIKDTSDSEELEDEDFEKDDSTPVFASEDNNFNERIKNIEGVVEFDQAKVGPSSAPKHGMENRYAKVQTNVNQRSTLNRTDNVHSNTVFASEDNNVNERIKTTEGVVEFDQANVGPSSAPKHGLENRYAKVQTDVNQRSTLNRTNTVPQMPRTPQFSMNPSPQLPYQQTQPHFNTNASSQMRQMPRVPVTSPDLPYQRNQPQFNNDAPSSHMNQMPPVGVPPNGFQRQDPSHSGKIGSTTKTFGIFSPQQKDNPSNGQSAPAVTNRYQKANPPGPGISLGATRPRMNVRQPGFNVTEGRGWEGANADNSNAYPNWNKEQADFRRR